MGTYYKVQVPESVDLPLVKRSIQAVLDKVNRTFSTWDNSSEISKFNQSPLGNAFHLSDTFFFLVQESLRLNALTEGYFDITLGNITKHWSLLQENSTLSAFEGILKNARYGSEYLSLDKDLKALIKEEEILLDMSAIAKGYAVDLIKESLLLLGIENFLVDIGGEIFVRGVNSEGVAWKVGIFTPDKALNLPSIAVSLSNSAVATSGDYHNFVRMDGRHYGHILDPIQGKFIDRSKRRVIAATVVSEQVYVADAYATAFTVMPLEKIRAFVNEKNIATCLFIVDNGETEYWMSDAFLAMDYFIF